MDLGLAGRGVVIIGGSGTIGQGRSGMRIITLAHEPLDVALPATHHVPPRWLLACLHAHVDLGADKTS